MNARLAIVVALAIAAPAPPAPPAAQAGEYVLYIGYRLPRDPAMEAEARGFVSECITRRATCSQACRVGAQDASCPVQCEVAFRECTLGVRGTRFWLGVCPRGSCVDGVKALFPLTAQEATHALLNPAAVPVEPNMYSTTGITVRLGDRCTFERAGGEPVRLASEYQLCEAIGALASASLAPGKKTPLIAAIEQNKLAVVEFLLARGVDPNEMGNTDGLMRHVTPLYVAESADVVKALLKAGADPTLGDSQGVTALHAGGRSVEAVKALIDAGADVNARTKGGETPLHGVSDQAVAALLISRGADVNATTADGDTPLHWTAYEDNLIGCHALVKAGADLNPKNKAGLTPLGAATEKRHFRIVLCLKVAGAKL